jgi:selenocysteine-specific translation elongation factor
MTLALIDNSLPAASPEILEKIALVEARIRPREHTLQVQMEHHLHAGMYARTCRLAANQVITSVLIKIPTLLIVNGDCVVLAGEKWHELKGYNVIPANSRRKQIYVTRGATEITMIFPTDAKTVQEAESEFTDEADSLLSRRAECQV